MSGLKTPLPERKRSYRVALTPLADAMFQLLIFFMLTTSLTPYSLITIRTAQEAPSAEEQGGNGPGPGPQSNSAPGLITIWTLQDGVVSSKGQNYDKDQLPALAEALGSQDDPGTVVLIVGETARVQDVAVAIEALKSADITAVQITREES